MITTMTGFGITPACVSLLLDICAFHELETGLLEGHSRHVGLVERKKGADHRFLTIISLICSLIDSLRLEIGAHKPHSFLLYHCHVYNTLAIGGVFLETRDFFSGNCPFVSPSVRTIIVHAMTDLSAGGSKEFARCMLPLFHGPCVRLRIKSSDHEYTVSKNLLCKESTYFSAMFQDGFQEGQQLKATLEDIEGIVSVQSLEAFLQWLYLRQFSFDLNEPDKQISAAIELARFADMCSVTDIEPHIAHYLKQVLVTNPNPRPLRYDGHIKTYCLTAQHISSASFLPQAHVVRRLLAAAMVERFLLVENDVLVQKTYKHSTFGADVLEEVRKTLKGLRIHQYDATYKDPIDGEEKRLTNFLNCHYSLSS